MPSAWLLGSLVVKSSLVVLLGSFVMGFIFFKFTSPFSKLEINQRLDEVGSILIAFTLSLWVGKALVKFSTFISDPAAVLAYPSDSRVFYIAAILTVVYLKYKMIKNYQHLLDLLLAWFNIFLVASFLYEFILFIGAGKGNALAYLGLLVVLITLVILLQGRITTEKVVFSTLLGWSLGQWILSIFANANVFQFYLNHWFYGAIFIGAILFILYRKRVKQ